MNPKMTISDAARFLGVSGQAVVKKIKNKNLSFEKSQNRIFFGYETSKKIFSLKIIPKILAFQIVKGGTGKSNIAMNVAVRANLYGLKVLCIDLDQQANLTELFRIDSEDLPVMLDIVQSKGKMKIENNLVEIIKGLHLFPSKLDNAALDDTILLNRLGMDKVYNELINPLRKYYDLIIIDCPPALGRSIGATAFAVDEIIAPVIPDKLCIRGLELLHKTLKELEIEESRKCIPYRIVYNKFDSRTSLSKKLLADLITHDIFKHLLNENYIRQSQDITNASANGISLFDSLKASGIKDDIDMLTLDLIGIKKRENLEKHEKKVSIISVNNTL